MEFWIIKKVEMLWNKNKNIKLKKETKDFYLTSKMKKEYNKKMNTKKIKKIILE